LERLALARVRSPHIVGVDICPAMVAMARRKLASAPSVRFEIAEAEALPFERDRFDVVVCASMVHHTHRPDRVFRECVSVLRPGGRFVLVDWCLDFRRNRLRHRWLRATDPTYAGMLRVDEAQHLLEADGVVLARIRRFIAPPAYGMMSLTGVKGSNPKSRETPPFLRSLPTLRR